jgi:hypothetical protein
MAIDLAHRYPKATRLYSMHAADEIWLPPPEPGIVAATIAHNDRFALLAGACSGAGEVVRIKQPIDLYRFGPKGRWARASPRRILLLGNYHGRPGARVDQLQAAWSRPGLEWRRIGYPQPSAAVAAEIADADIVVGYGRSILEAMASGRPAYVHDHSGSDGWVTAETYDRLDADGFAGTGVRPTPSLVQLREDFLQYDPMLGLVGHDFARAHHDARLVTAEIVNLVKRLASPSQYHDPLALKALRNLAESRFRADVTIHQFRAELQQNTQARLAEQEETRQARTDSDLHRAELSQANQTILEQQEELHQLRLIMQSRRFALMRAIFKPIDWVRSLINRCFSRRI